MTRIEFARHFPAVLVSKDPPVVASFFAITPGDDEYCHLGGELYLVMRVDYKQANSLRPYPILQNPVKRGNRVGSVAIPLDQAEHVLFLKARPHTRDVIHSARVVSGTDDYLLNLYKQYKEAESLRLTLNSWNRNQSRSGHPST